MTKKTVRQILNQAMGSIATQQASASAAQIVAGQQQLNNLLHGLGLPGQAATQAHILDRRIVVKSLLEQITRGIDRLRESDHSVDVITTPEDHTAAVLAGHKLIGISNGVSLCVKDRGEKQ